MEKKKGIKKSKDKAGQEHKEKKKIASSKESKKTNKETNKKEEEEESSNRSQSDAKTVKEKREEPTNSTETEKEQKKEKEKEIEKEKETEQEKETKEEKKNEKEPKGKEKEEEISPHEENEEKLTSSSKSEHEHKNKDENIATSNKDTPSIASSPTTPEEEKSGHSDTNKSKNKHKKKDKHKHKKSKSKKDPTTDTHQDKQNVNVDAEEDQEGKQLKKSFSLKQVLVSGKEKIEEIISSPRRAATTAKLPKVDEKQTKEPNSPKKIQTEEKQHDDATSEQHEKTDKNSSKSKKKTKSKTKKKTKSKNKTKKDENKPLKESGSNDTNNKNNKNDNTTHGSNDKVDAKSNGEDDKVINRPQRSMSEVGGSGSNVQNGQLPPKGAQARGLPGVKRYSTVYTTLADAVSPSELLDLVLNEDYSKLQYLADRGVNLNAVDDSNGYAPIHWAVLNGKRKAMEWLLTHGADVNARDNTGWTALHYASQNGRLDLMKILVENKADASIKNRQGKTAEQLAKRDIAKSVTNLLKEAKKAPRRSKLFFMSKPSSSTKSNPDDESEMSLVSSKGSSSPDQARKTDQEGSENFDAELASKNQEVAELLAKVKQRELELYMKEKELHDLEEHINSRKAFVEVREQKMAAMDLELNKKKDELKNRQQACEDFEEKHRIMAISASVMVIDFDELTLEEVLGEGSFSQVRLARWRGDHVAVKIIKDQRQDQQFRTQFQQEASFLSKLRHGNIVQLMAVCLDYPNMSLIMELMPNGTVEDLIAKAKKTHTRLGWDVVLRIAKDTARGMNFLHQMKPPLIHRDLKPANLMLDDRMKAKIVDLGFVQSKYSAKEGDTFAGSPAYAAPECLRQEEFDEKSDVYSYGYVLWQFLSETAPWKGTKPMEVVARVGFNREKLSLPSPLPDGCPQKLVSLISSCWADEAAERPSFAQILSILAGKE
jgi:ankyrin repeat protein